MSYATKRKIADCVKILVRHKEISRITIQDIMDETHMSRQSFYYHFKDIYDVLEWIGLNDFKAQLVGENYDDLAPWCRDLMSVLWEEHTFYERIAREIEWPCIARSVKNALSKQVYRLLLVRYGESDWKQTEEFRAYADFLVTSICYYMIDYVYDYKNLSEKEIETNIQFLLQMSEQPWMIKAGTLPKAAAM